MEPVGLVDLDATQLGQPQRGGLRRDDGGDRAHPWRQPGRQRDPIEARASTAGSAEIAAATPALARIGSSAASASGSVRSPEATIQSPVSVPSAPSGPWIRSGGEKPSAGMPLSSRSFSADSQAVE